ncbi:complex I subunit 5 family protein [Coralloluteibacterium thermophilus]|uniref:Complex I subunit 5 family protein n=1 Tax=Coralloluteibacterium thermophilum TaxID=2707049 RepID=A0ABV9NNW3_9GAMM
MTTEAALAALVFGPLSAAAALVLLGGGLPRLRAGIVLAALLAPLALLVPPTLALRAQPVIELALAGQVPPLGIGLRLDALALVMLWLVAVVGAGAGLHAFRAQPPQAVAGTRFWPVWLLMMAGLNAFFLSADLFNLYVAIELVTLAGVALVSWSGKAAALRAAMRYLLLAMLASLAYLLAVALLYSEHGTLDLYLLAGVAGEGSGATRTALALAVVSLLLKGAIFPLHIWLPPAHARAPGAVSAVLSALVVKTALYLLYRLWFWTLDGAQPAAVGVLLGALGGTAALYGSVAALVQVRLKRMVAYSTVAQLGYLMLVFPLAAAAGAGAVAWHGAIYQLLAHALAKSAMFLAAANLLQGLGSDRLPDLAGAGRRLPLSVFAFAVAGVSLMGLPPSGGFLAKWLMLEAAWMGAGWGWMAVLLVGSLLASVYVFRALSAMFAAPADDAPRPPVALPRTMELAALALAALAIAAGFASAPVFGLLDAGPPFPVVDPSLPVVEETP